jgi:hypothetical protein
MDSSRRTFIKKGAFGLLVLSGANACQMKRFTCSDETSLDETQKATRKSLAYTDVSSDKNKLCKDCVQWVPLGDECGNCKVLAGPVHPAGTCNLFAAKAG